MRKCQDKKKKRKKKKTRKIQINNLKAHPTNEQ